MSLRPRNFSPSTLRVANAKSFSICSIARSNEDGSELTNRSQANHLLIDIGPPKSASGQPQPRRGGKNINLGPGGSSITLRTAPSRTAQPSKPRAPALSIRKIPFKGQNQGQGQANPSGPPSTVLRRTGTGTGRLTSGKIQGSRFVRNSKTVKPGGGHGGKPQTDKRMALARGKAKEDKESEEDADVEDIDAMADDYVAKYIDTPVNPTEPIQHVPGENMSIGELRKDWPNIPLSATGLTESVQQRIEFLAHRLPHGYQTPMQLAERYRKGKLTRFESEEEKETVLKLATEVAKEKADKISEKKGVEIQPKDMAFDSLSTRSDERNALAGAYVKGDYPTLEKQKMPFLDQIARNLRNNDTYNAMQSEQFMKAIAKMTSQRQ